MEGIRCTEMKLLKWSTVTLFPQMRLPVNLPAVWGTKPAWAYTSLSIGWQHRAYYHHLVVCYGGHLPLFSTPFYVIYQTSNTHTGVESPAKRRISWEGFQISLTETFMKKTSGSIVHARSRIAAGVLWVWLGVPGTWHHPLIYIAFVLENAGG